MFIWDSIDYTKLISKPNFGVKVIVEEGNFNKWNIILPGPKFSAYEDCDFNISFEFENYPFRCPEVKFITPIYHPNIKKDTGEICMNAFYKDWTPTMTVLNIIEKIVSILAFPSIESPIEYEIAKEYSQNYNQWKNKVKEYNEKYKGMRILDIDKNKENEENKENIENKINIEKEEEQLIYPKNKEEENKLILLALKNSEEEAKRIMEEEKQLQKILRESGNESNINKMEIEEEFDEEYGICPITLEYMEHPVLCPSGNYYEKWAIIDWIKKNNTDPLTREKLTIDMLVEDEEYRIKIIEYRRKYNK